MLLLLLLCQINSILLVFGEINSLSVLPGQSSKDHQTESVSTHHQRERFVPNSEWQTVKPGQHIPRGLHVRLNLETGAKEAKVLEKSDRNYVGEENDKFVSITEIKDSLRHLSKQIDKDQPIASSEEKTKKFRSYEELKKELGQLDLNVKTELEIVTELLTEFKLENCTNERKIEILTELEFHLHQVDNARNFVNLGGLDLLKQTLNQSNIEFRKKTAFLLAGAAQNNPHVQMAALDNGLLHELIRKFPTEIEIDVKGRYLYAIGSLIRHYPVAQKKFLELGGIELFLKVLYDSNDPLFYKHKLRVVTVVSDLLTERQNLEEKSPNEYNEISLNDYLQENGWCTQLPKLLKFDDIDFQEKVLYAMNISKETCTFEFMQHRKLLNSLRENLENEISADVEGNFEFLKDMDRTINEILQNLNRKVEL